MDSNIDESNQESFIIPDYKDANSYCQDALRNILCATKASNELPSAGDDFDYYSTFQGFRTVMLHKGQSILSLMTSLIQKQGINEKFQGKELEEKFDLLVDVNDILLENVSNYLDEASGVKKSEEELILAVKPQSAINTSWNKKTFSPSSQQSFKLLAAKNISRPQLSFKDKIDNSNAVFVPSIKEKPNSIKPLAVTLEKDGDKEEFCHPYELEIEKFNPSEELLQNVEPTRPKPLEETPLVLVKTKEQLIKLCIELKGVKEIAIDLEHHAYRSFQGFTCLMQLSTREKDYIVDVLDLRCELYILNEVFTDPKIVKVLHGADMDVLWLQRDFGLYLVNLFDTGQAARVLSFAHLSLSFLLKHYLKLDLDKQFQLADWRIRPLPAEMLKYARQDTHYLLYLYDCLKVDLIKNGNTTKNLLRTTFDRSKLICLKKYRKPQFSEDKYLELYKKSKKVLNAKQLYCLKELYSWRDRIARENDESLLYVLPNHMLLQIAEALPREQQGVLACCNPIPPLVKQQMNEIHSIVLKANETSLKQLAELELLQHKAQSRSVNHHIDLNNLLHCPHDILHAEEKRVQASESFSSDHLLPEIVNRTKHLSVPLMKQEASLSALFKESSKKKHKEDHSASFKKASEMISKLISPIQRYKMTQQLQMNEQVNDSSDNPTNNTINLESSVEQSSHNESHASDASVICIKEENKKPSSETSSLDISEEVYSSTPLRKTANKKKKRKAQPDLPFSCTPISVPAPKKSKTPEVIEISDDSFKPFDYSQADYKTFSGKKKSKEIFKPGTQHNFKAPGKHVGRDKKHFKQGTFSGEAKQRKKTWPQNK